MSVTQVYKVGGSVTGSPWRYLRRLEAECCKRAVQDSQEFWASSGRGQAVDDVHDLQGGSLTQFIIRRMDGEEFAKFQAYLAQPRKDRLAFAAHISPVQKILSVAP